MAANFSAVTTGNRPFGMAAQPGAPGQQREPGAQQGLATIQYAPAGQQSGGQVNQQGQQQGNQQGNPMLAPGLPLPTPTNPFPTPTNPLTQPFTGLGGTFGNPSVTNPLGLSAPNPLGVPAPNPFNPLQPFGADSSTVKITPVFSSGNNGVPANLTPYSGGAHRPGVVDATPQTMAAPAGSTAAPAGSTVASAGGPAHATEGPVATRPNWNQYAQQYGLRGGYMDQGRGGPYGNF
jgi:hypothetical protein